MRNWSIDTALLRSLYWAPLHQVNMDRVRSIFTLEMESPSSPNHEPEIINVFKISRQGNLDWLGLPRGRPDLVRSALKGSGIKYVIDLRTSNKVKLPLEFQGSFKPFQRKAVKAMSKVDGGVLKSAPRTGKTIMGVEILLRRRQKTLILAHQRDLVEQFCNETINHASAKLYDGAKHKGLAGICRTYSDFQRHSICLATYQTFLSKKGVLLQNKIKNLFGVVMVDEVHRAPATRYFQILSKFSAKTLYGLTATDDRKDGRWVLSELLVGPVAHETKPDDLLTPIVHGHYTPFKPPAVMPKTWVGLENMLFRSKPRNSMIVDMVLRDVKQNHVVLLPIKRVQHGMALMQDIDNAWGSKICFLFTGSIPKDKRQWARDKMNNDMNVKVVLATRSMLTGMNVPRWSAVYTFAPISNVPTYTQEVQRICTYMKGKEQPIIRYFFDSAVGLSYGCFHTCLKTLKEYKHHRTFKEMADKHGRRRDSSENTVWRAPS